MASGDVAIPQERLRMLEQSGQWEGALAEYARLFDEAVGSRDLLALVTVCYRQARMLQGWERYAQAEEMAELCREVALRTDQESFATRALHLLAISRFFQGDAVAAEALYHQVVEEALDVGDDPLVGFASQNLGVIADARGDLEEARRCYLESVGACVRSGDRLGSVMVYNNLGITCGKMGEYMEAEQYFDRGIEVAEHLSHLPLLALLHANRSAPLIGARDYARARETLDRAEALARSAQVVSTLAEVARMRGVLARETGHWEEAEQRFAEALRLSGTAKQPLTRAETLEELAELRWRCGRRAEGLAMLGRALREYREFHAAPRAARVAERLAEWEREAGVAGAAPAPDVRLSPQARSA